MARKKPAPSGRSFRLHGPRLQILKNIAVDIAYQHRETLTESDVLHALVDCLEKNAVDNSEYTLSNGMYAHVGNGRSVQAEAGVNVGHRFTLKNGATLQPYFGAAVTQEFIDDNEVDVNSDGHFQNDTSGTRGVYQAGLRAQFSPRLTAHIDASYAEGSHIESPWIAHAGIAWSF